MLRLPSWIKHQGAIINHVRSSRKTRGLEQDADLAMQRFNVSTTWDRDFIERFAPAVGQRSAETFLIRVLQYVAAHAGMTGECRVPRDEFGRLVLSRVGDAVNRKTGQTVYDALVKSGIAQPITGDDTGGNTGDALPFRAVPSPSDPPPSAPARADTAGGSASQVDPVERRCVLAACGAILGEKDINPRVRDAAKAMRLKITEGSASPEIVDEFLNANVWSRESARIAYLGARKQAS